MKKLPYTILAVALASVALTGCQSIQNVLGKRDNGSLDYQHAQKLDPIQLPISQPSADFAPLYPTPAVGDNTLSLSNDSGKQYQLPAPPKVVR